MRFPYPTKALFHETDHRFITRALARNTGGQPTSSRPLASGISRVAISAEAERFGDAGYQTCKRVSSTDPVDAGIISMPDAQQPVKTS